MGSNSSSGRKASNSCAFCGTEPRPPPTTSSKPRFFWPSTVRVRAMQPMSWKFARPHGLSLQPENATLNLRPKFCVSSWPSKNIVSACAYGATSNDSVWQTPAYGQAVTLRTVLPHASRVVMPTAASRRIRSGVSSICT